MSPMGGKRHKGVGFNRPEKKKVTSGAAVVTSTRTAEESEDDPEEEAAPNLEPPQPAPRPAPALLVEAAASHASSAITSLYKHLASAWAAEAIAQRHLAKKERRWRKAKETYITSGKYSRFDERSVVKRVEQRLWKADVELQ